MTESKVRVLFAIGSLGGGGAERQVIEYLTHLNRSRFVPFLYLLSEEGELCDEVPDDVAVEAFANRHRYPRLNFPGRISRMQANDLAAVMRRWDIDVLCTVTFLLTLIGRRSIRRFPAAWIAVDQADPRLDFDHSTVRFRRLKKRILAQAYRETDATVAVSDGVKEGLVEFFGTPREHIHTIYNFLDLNRIDRLAQVPCDPPFDTDRFHIVTIGRMQEQKGHVDLLHAIDQLVNRQNHRRLLLHIFGHGPLESKLKDFVAAHGLQNHVRFWGFVRSPYNYLQAADLFCLSSIFEGLPLVLIEAMACRVPVLSTDCPSGPREILADGQYGRLVPPANPAALANAIEDVMQQTDPQQTDRWRETVQAARVHIEQTFSPKAGMAKIESLLLRACHRL